MTSITIPYAVADFVEMRERGFYYVDKTKYIAKLETYNAPIFLRPPRFGKSYDFSKMVMANDIENLEQYFTDLNCSPVEIMEGHNRDLFGDFQFNTRGNASKMLEDVLKLCPGTRTD